MTDSINTKTSYQFISGNGYLTLRLIGDPNPDHADTMAQEFHTLMKEPYPHLIVNCEHLSVLNTKWVRSLVAIKNELKKVNHEVVFIMVSRSIREQFRNEGLDSSFKIKASLREALVELKLVTKKALDTDFINPFLAATMKVLEVQAQTKITPGKIYLKKEQGKFSGDISGVIGIVSEAFNGSVVISFPEKTFLAVISRMLGEEFKELTKEIADGAGELTNMIFGQAKITLNEKGYGIKTALPSVVTGKDHSVSALNTGATVTVPFESDVGSFFVEICLSE